MKHLSEMIGAFIMQGSSDGEMYMKDGVKIHVRQMKSFLVPGGQKDSRITVRPTVPDKLD